ncbi:heavy metal translocating P-type ATPase [Candidatus Sumerlaeota bacterium]|nr:heavy metal translocating P-type ATPase [Candidatus Sumerlaeota bacterium]
MARITFHISGMDCAEEVAALRAALKSNPGIENLSFEVLNAKMSVQYDETKTSPDEIARNVAKTGMRAVPSEDGGGPQPPASNPAKHGPAILTATSAAALLAGASIHHILGGANEAAGSPAEIISRILYGIAIGAGLWLVLPKAWYALRNFRPDMNLLMVVAAIGACAIGEWMEGATVAFLFSLSLLLETWSVGRARRAIGALLDLSPPKARVVHEHKHHGDEHAHLHEDMMDVARVPVGATVSVKPGERFPLDGRILIGETTVNEAPITGESLPVAKQHGSDVFAGTINGDGAVQLITTKPADETTLARIIRMVGEAQQNRAPSEQWVETFARVYTPIVMATALIVAVLPGLMTGDWQKWVYEALALLVIACPCALVISTPVSIVAALTSAARHGVLVKGGMFMERPARIRVLAMDKTGTLTRGQPEVTGVFPLSGHEEQELLSIAGAISSQSLHPLSQGVVRYAESRAPKISAATDFQMLQGKGGTAVLNGERVWIGSHKHLEERGQETPEMHATLEELSANGSSVVVVGNEEHVCGFITLADTVREESPAMVNALKASGVERIVMLTGDNEGTARAIAAKTGVDEFIAELLPEDKVSAVERLRDRYGPVAMIGDGVNDAPALARSDLGIAMGSGGTDAAIETADIALMNDNLARVPWLFKHSRRTLGIIRANIALSLLVKAVFVILTFAGFASLWGAIAADTGMSLLVVANALRLLKTDVDGWEAA